MFTVGQVQENTYVVRRDGSDRALIIDPGDEPEKLLGAIEALGVQLDAILLTHEGLARLTSAINAGRTSAAFKRS